jgi:predicted DNA-binding ribbon-helix-helix protein
MFNVERYDAAPVSNDPKTVCVAYSLLRPFLEWRAAGVVTNVTFESRRVRSLKPKGTNMDTAIVKRSVVIAGHKTSISLEDEFWTGFKELARERKMTLSSLLGGIDTGRRQTNLSSSVRLFVLDHYRNQLAMLAADQSPAGTGNGAATITSAMVTDIRQSA